MVQGQVLVDFAEGNIDCVDPFSEQVFAGFQQRDRFSHATLTGDEDMLFGVFLLLDLGQKLHQGYVFFVVVFIQDVDLRVPDGRKQFASDLIQSIVAALLILALMVHAQMGNNIVGCADGRIVRFVTAEGVPL